MPPTSFSVMVGGGDVGAGPPPSRAVVRHTERVQSEPPPRPCIVSAEWNHPFCSCPNQPGLPGDCLLGPDHATTTCILSRAPVLLPSTGPRAEVWPRVHSCRQTWTVCSPRQSPCRSEGAVLGGSHRETAHRPGPPRSLSLCSRPASLPCTCPPGSPDRGCRPGRTVEAGLSKQAAWTPRHVGGSAGELSKDPPPVPTPVGTCPPLLLAR